MRFWHDNGAYMPYGLIVPIMTSTQLLGPYKPDAYRVEFDSLYTNTVIVTPYRGAGRPQGCFVMERTMDAIAAELGMDRTEVRARNFVQPDEMPYDQGLMFQDGRPLIYDSGDFPGRWPSSRSSSAGTTSARGTGRRGRGPEDRHRPGCYVEGTGVGPYEGGHVLVETSGKVKVATGLTARARVTRPCSPRSSPTNSACRLADVEVVTGDTRDSAMRSARSRPGPR